MYTTIQGSHKIIMLSEKKSQANKNMYYMIPFTQKSGKLMCMIESRSLWWGKAGREGDGRDPQGAWTSEEEGVFTTLSLWS